MSSVIKELSEKNVINPPKYVKNQTQFETMMGSFAYGVADVGSDIDIYGFCIPYKEVMFPHLNGEILGFGRQTQRFENYVQHHIFYKEKEYDLTIYSIVKYFQLCMENNPNMVDSLFVPSRCITYSSQIGQMVRENRRLFLSKKSWHTFKGYAYSQLNKMRNKKIEGKRKELVDKYGYDVKFAYHLVRLLEEVKQILSEGDLDLERNREQLKSIRRGDRDEKEIIEYFESQEKNLESLYVNSSAVPYSPPEDKIKQLLLNCLEEFYGSLDNMISMPDKFTNLYNDLRDVLDKYNNKA